ncbi:MAG TPA: hypothetical protein VNT02_03890 [Burkholderiales bacterium]|nr:hypothetical protein [Burkholderiales bacterium]
MVLIEKTDGPAVNRQPAFRDYRSIQIEPPHRFKGSITLDEYWMGRDVTYRHELTDEISRNALLTVERVNRLLAVMAERGVHALCKPGTRSAVASGWRPVAINASVPAAVPDSPHISGAACDLYDPAGALDDWCLAHVDALEALQLWLEHPEYTDGWCHVQIVAPRCGSRVFRPW